MDQTPQGYILIGCGFLKWSLSVAERVTLMRDEDYIYLWVYGEIPILLGIMLA